MKILIPTAKEMNTDLPSIEAAPLRPESQAVLDVLALYSASQLGSFYKVSAEKAAEEFQHIQALKRQTAQHYPALKLFDGLMYRHIKRDKLTEAEQAYLEIMSSLLRLCTESFQPCRLWHLTVWTF